MRRLGDLIDPALGWQLVQANAVNAHGMIVGWGYHNGAPARLQARASRLRRDGEVGDPQLPTLRISSGGEIDADGSRDSFHAEWMNRPPRLTIGAGALAGGVAGALVGFADGIRAALLVGTRRAGDAGDRRAGRRDRRRAGRRGWAPPSSWSRAPPPGDGGRGRRRGRAPSRSLLAGAAAARRGGRRGGDDRAAQQPVPRRRADDAGRARGGGGRRRAGPAGRAPARGEARAAGAVVVRGPGGDPAGAAGRPRCWARRSSSRCHGPACSRGPS